MSLSKTVMNPPNHPPMAPFYSHICAIPISETAKIFLFAGQIGLESQTDFIPSTITDQITLALSNVDRCLTAAGATRKDIVQCRMYVVDLHNRIHKDRETFFIPEIEKQYTAFMDGHFPPLTLIGVEALADPELMFEFEVWAIVKA